jgi:seryl-tRNA synthetase
MLLCSGTITDLALMQVEQFIICNPEESWKHFDEMIAVSEEFYQSLKLPYQVVAIVSGALNNAAAKKFDLEALFPFQNEYKELVSCSNCLDCMSSLSLCLNHSNFLPKHYLQV